MTEPLALSTILQHPSTIRFMEGSDDADLGDIDLTTNPQKSSFGPFVWLSADRSETSVTFVGKVIYSGIGDKTGPYFSLPDSHWMPEITVEEMAKAKAGFAIRFINHKLVADVTSSDELVEHNQAVLEFFLTLQEASDQRLGTNSSNPKPVTNVRSFIKVEEGNPFFVLPVISEPLFPQFKGPRTPGFTRTKRQRGRISLNPGGDPRDSMDEEDPESHRVLFCDLVDPKNRYSVLKNNPVHQRYEMCIPPVYTADGNTVVPSMYEDMIPDGTLSHM